MAVKYSVKRVDDNHIVIVAESENRSELLESSVLHECLKMARDKGYANYGVVESPILAYYEDGEPVTAPRSDKKIIYQRHVQCAPTQFP